MTKTCCLIATCCLSLLATSSATFACDKANGSAAKGATVNLVKAGTTCPYALRAAGTVTAADVTQITRCCQTASKVATVRTVEAKDAGCPIQQSANLMMRALGRMSDCGTDCPGRADLVAAVRTLDTFRPGLVCDKKLASLAGASSRSVSPAALSARKDGIASRAQACSSARAKVATVAAPVCGGVAKVVTTAGNARTCRASSRANARVASAVVTSSDLPAKAAATPARYVAFGCDKSDRIARAAAEAYLTVMRDLKLSSGAEGCSAQAASRVLAAVLTDGRRAAADTEVAVVSFGAVSDVATSGGSDRPACCTGKK